ncbi:hypothetical protein ACWG0P_10345 [Amedibacillus sp. YH-ame6]
MIPYFDKFVDTREKRYHLLLVLTLLSALLLILPYLLLGAQLSFLSTYDSLYELLEKPYIEWTFISRMIVDVISIASFHLPNIIECIVSNLGVLDVICIVLVVISFGILETKRSFTICLLILVIEVLACCGFAFCSLSAGSLQPVITNIKWMGGIILLSNSILGILVLYHVLRQIKKYCLVYQYEVQEIKEHVS